MPSKPKNNPSTFVYNLLFVKWNFVFALRKSGRTSYYSPGNNSVPHYIATGLAQIHINGSSVK